MIVHVCESNSNSQQTFSDDLAILADLPPNQSMMGRRSVPDYTAPELEASRYAKIMARRCAKCVALCCYHSNTIRRLEKTCRCKLRPPQPHSMNQQRWQWNDPFLFFLRLPSLLFSGPNGCKWCLLSWSCNGQGWVVRFVGQRASSKKHRNNTFKYSL